MTEGTLIVNAKKQIRIKFTNPKGKEVEMAVPDAELSQSLKKEQREKLNDRKVELEVEDGQPKKVRPVGEPFTAAAAQPPQQSGRPQRGRRNQPERRERDRDTPVPKPAFHNPYNFVPALPRDRVTDELGDHPPVGHHVLHPGRITGVIRVKMTVKTPLLVPDSANVVDCPNDHKSFPVRIDAEGQPYIPPTSIKGMLRTAYEAVTNSRLAVFPAREAENNHPPAGHAVPLAYRMNAEEGLRLVPARVESGQLQLLMGTTTGYPNWDPNARNGRGGWIIPGPMYAAWLPRYHRGNLDRSAPRYPNDQLPQHRDEVECWVELIQHWRWVRPRRQGQQGHHQQDFQFWRVRRIVRRSDSLGSQPVLSQDRGKKDDRSYYQPLGQIQRVTGFVCITNANIDRKHDERVFFHHQPQSNQRAITPELQEQWRVLICNYQDTHEDDLADRARRGQQPDQYVSRAPGRTAWSRHVYQQSAEELADSTLCYAMLDDRDQVTALFPVMISRRLFECSPFSLLPASLRPATSLEQLSPADRVFGWVNQQGKGAYRGNLRIGPVTCETPDAIESFDAPGVPLTILGQPKPQQARFYVAASPNGEAQENGLTKEQAGYSPGKGLRGRKVYPHHAGLPDDHWDQPTTDRTQQAKNGHFQEYRRPDDSEKVRDKQNRSIQGWVKPRAEFTFDIHVTNLSKVELGALLWLLGLPENHFHRFGGGKPLGFGSIRLEIDSAHTHLYDGNGWKQTYYATLEDTTPTEADRGALIRAFQKEVQTSYTSNPPAASFEDVPFIAAWLRAATGHGDSLPTHYPRVSPHPNPAGENFRWFTENENEKSGQRECLGDLPNDPGLSLPNGQGGN